MTPTLQAIASNSLNVLCNVPSRATGSEGNRYATDWFARSLAASGFAVQDSCFDCMDWSTEGASICAADKRYPAQPSPYSLGCDVRAELAVVRTLHDLEAKMLSGRVVLMIDDLAHEQLMPKNFTFYNPERHQRIYQLLEAQQPAAIIAATYHDPSMAGGLSPFPVFEDGDFDIPSVYLKEQDGKHIAQEEGQFVHVRSLSRRRPSTACNVIGRKAGQSQQRIVVMAHIDAKASTPGALDNGTGITTLLLLAKALDEFDLRHTIEIVAINGEDYYSSPGEMDYIRTNEGKFDSITLGINLDGLGYVEGQTAYSLYGCAPEMSEAIQAGFAAYPEFREGESWYQGDHMMLIMQGRPALALTSEQVAKLMNTIVHTQRDTPALVDTAKLVEAAYALRDIILRVEMLGTSL